MHDGEQKIVLAVQGAIDRQAEQERKADAYQGLVELVMQYQGCMLLLNAISPAGDHQLADCDCLRCKALMEIEAALKAAGELK